MLKPQICDNVLWMKKALAGGKNVLIEGANAALLDIDFGTYPYVTSSNTCIGAVNTGLGIPPREIEVCVGVVKAYCTRVGKGPFPTEQQNDVGEHLGTVGHEFGTTTGRARRCGWLDIPMLHFSNALNGYTSMNITKLDVMTGLNPLKIGVSYKDRRTGRILEDGEFPDNLEDLAAVDVVYEEMEGWSEDIAKCRKVDELPKQAIAYMRRIEELVRLPVSWIGVGPDRDDMFLTQD